MILSYGLDNDNDDDDDVDVDVDDEVEGLERVEIRIRCFLLELLCWTVVADNC